MTKVRTKVTKKVLKRKLSRIPAEEKAELLSELTKETQEEVKQVQEGRVPGRVVGGQKTTWTYKDLERHFRITSFVPEETIPITINGVRVQLLEGIEITCPECYHQVYQQHRAGMRQRPSLPDLGFINEVLIGAGGLPPRRTE